MNHRGLLAAFIVGEGLYVWRVVHKYHRPPVPGDLLAITAMFAVLGFAADYEPAAPFVTAVAWGLDIAGFLRLFPNGLGEQISKTEQTAAAAGPAAATGSAGRP